MASQPSLVRIGTRGSALARWQADHVAQLLQAAHPALRVEVVVIVTRGDRVLDTPLPLIGGKGLFTAELEAALRGGAIDLVVHSLKDLPTENPPGLAIGAVPPRAAAHDVLVSRAGHTLATLPPGAGVGTSSTRRAAQLRAQRPDLQILDIRGNIPTRIGKALDPQGPYDAILLARAGLERLGCLDAASETLPLDVMLPAPGQGALAVQCRDEAPVRALLRPIDHDATRLAVTAERAFLAGLGGGCAVPVAAYGEIDGMTLVLRGRVSAPDGSQQIDVATTQTLAETRVSGAEEAQQIGHALADQALRQGAGAMLEVSS